MITGAAMGRWRWRARVARKPVPLLLLPSPPPQKLLFDEIFLFLLRSRTRPGQTRCHHLLLQILLLPLNSDSLLLGSSLLQRFLPLSFFRLGIVSEPIRSSQQMMFHSVPLSFVVLRVLSEYFDDFIVVLVLSLNRILVVPGGIRQRDRFATTSK